MPDAVHAHEHFDVRAQLTLLGEDAIAHAGKGAAERIERLVHGGG